MLIQHVFLYCGDLPRRSAMSHWSYRTIEATNTTPEIDKKVNDMAGHFQPLGVAALIQPIYRQEDCQEDNAKGRQVAHVLV